MSLTTSLRARKKQRTSDDLFDAALQLFAERGYDEVTVEQICELAEVSRATFFRYYGAKAGLVTEFNRRLADRVSTRLVESPDASATDQLFAVQRVLADAWTSSGSAVRAMTLDFARITASAAAHTPAPYPELLTIVTDIIESGQATGEFDTTHSPAFVASTIGGLLGGITMFWLATRRGRLDRAMHDALDLLIAGLATHPKNQERNP